MLFASQSARSAPLENHREASSSVTANRDQWNEITPACQHFQPHHLVEVPLVLLLPLKAVEPKAGFTQQALSNCFSTLPHSLMLMDNHSQKET